MADIFLSYKREDREKVRPLAEALEGKGWSVWWDTRIGVGETWDKVIETELAAAKCVVAVWSRMSIDSDWVRAEAHEGRERKCLVPVTIEGVTPPSIFKMMQATDLTHWSGKAGDPQFVHLCDGIERLIPPIRPWAPRVVESERPRYDAVIETGPSNSAEAGTGILREIGLDILRGMWRAKVATAVFVVLAILAGLIGYDSLVAAKRQDWKSIQDKARR